MRRSSTWDRLQRLEQLKARLKSDEVTTVADLAVELDISARSVNRDIQLLREQGLDIEADRGRGGGVRLNEHWGVGRVNLNYAEAVDLLMTLAIAEQINSPLFMANLKTIRRKLIASFSTTMKLRVRNLKSRILIAPASANVLNHHQPPVYPQSQTLHQAFLMQQAITFDYQPESGAATTCTVQPHYLLLSASVWYLLAWDELRGAVRTFRCDCIINAEIEPVEFKLLSFTRFEEVLGGVDVL